MKYAGEDIINEHEEILLGLKIMETISGLIKTGKEALLKELEEISQCLKLFVDKCHHGKEEELLFTAMERAGIPKEKVIIGQMLEEHQESRQCLEIMDKAIAGKGTFPEAFLKSYDAYLFLLRKHIEKEMQCCFHWETS